jgi:hypothetical protein
MHGRYYVGMILCFHIPVKLKLWWEVRKRTAALMETAVACFCFKQQNTLIKI